MAAKFNASAVDRKFYSMPPAKLSPRSIQTTTLSTSSCSFAFGSVLKPHNSGPLLLHPPNEYWESPGPHNPNFRNNVKKSEVKEQVPDLNETILMDSDKEKTSGGDSVDALTESIKTTSPPSSASNTHTQETLPSAPSSMRSTSKDFIFENGPWVVRGGTVVLPEGVSFEDGTPAR